jgi:4-hydroxy-2-oxoheptanedioate aldolase
MPAPAWVSGRVTYGGWCGIPSSVSVEPMAAVGFDWLGFDMQRSAIGADDLLPMLQAACINDVPVLVRVPWNDAASIMRVLDLCAAGVIVPMVNTAAEARQAAGACLSPPDGYRSFGPVRRRSKPPLCSVMIETVEAVENVDEILAVPRGRHSLRGAVRPLQLLRDELDASMGLCGRRDLRSLTPALVERT